MSYIQNPGTFRYQLLLINAFYLHRQKRTRVHLPLRLFHQHKNRKSHV